MYFSEHLHIKTVTYYMVEANIFNSKLFQFSIIIHLLRYFTNQIIFRSAFIELLNDIYFSILFKEITRFEWSFVQTFLSVHISTF